MKRFAVRLLIVWLTLTGRAAATGLEVTITGLESPLRENVAALLSLEQERESGTLTEERIRLLYAQAPHEIRAALEPFGYYRPVIRPALDRTDDAWTARFEVEPGPVVPIGRIDIEIRGEARDDPTFTKGVDQFALKVGDPADHRKYETGKRALVRLASDRGYVKATMATHELVVDVPRYTARVHIVLDSGVRYRFGEVIFEPVKGIDPEFLRRYSHIVPGTWWDAAQVAALESGLAQSGMFDRVEVVPQPDAAAPEQTVIRVRGTPATRDRFVVGLGYGTDTGPRARAGWERPLITPQGHRLFADAKLSETRQTATAGYTIPVEDPRTDFLEFTANIDRTDEDTLTSMIRSLSTGYSHVRIAWRETWTLDLEREDWEVGADNGVTNRATVGVSWLRSEADDRAHTRRGWRLLFDAHTGFNIDEAREGFLQLRARGDGIVSFSESTRLLARLEAGTTFAPSFETLPASLRFFAGGSDSVRGYAVDSIGPVDASGLITGGLYLTTGTVEMDYEFLPKWRAAAFADTGRAFNETSEPWSVGLGLGIRWQSPIGPIRMDVANAYTVEGRPWRLHLTVGPDL